MKRNLPDGFVAGDARLDEILARPGMPARIDAINKELKDADRTYLMGLSMIRKAASQTQQDMAARLGISQGAVAQTEAREDLLLSTLHSYAEAAGARVRIVVEFENGRLAELDLNVAAE